MKKIIVAFGAFVCALSPSLEATENYEVPNGFSGMKRDIILRLCDLIGSDCHNQIIVEGRYRFKEDEKIRNMIGMCLQHLLWKVHHSFLRCRKQRAKSCIEKGRNFVAKSRGIPVDAPIKSVDDVMAVLRGGLQHYEFAGSAVTLFAPMIKDLFVLNRLDESLAKNVLRTAFHHSVTREGSIGKIRDWTKFSLTANGFADNEASHYLLDAAEDEDTEEKSRCIAYNEASHYLLDAAEDEDTEEKSRCIAYRTGCDILHRSIFGEGGTTEYITRLTSFYLARFLIERGVADYEVLHRLWGAGFTNVERIELTRPMHDLGGIDVNYAWARWPDGYETIRDMDRYAENDQFLESIGAKKFDDLLESKKSEHKMRIAQYEIPWMTLMKIKISPSVGGS